MDDGVSVKSATIDVDVDDDSRHYTTVIRCYKIIKAYFNLEEPGDELAERFTSWLECPVNGMEKNIALEVVFNESLQAFDHNMPDQAIDDYFRK